MEVVEVGDIYYTPDLSIAMPYSKVLYNRGSQYVIQLGYSDGIYFIPSKHVEMRCSSSKYEGAVVKRMDLLTKPGVFEVSYENIEYFIQKYPGDDRSTAPIINRKCRSRVLLEEDFSRSSIKLIEFIDDSFAKHGILPKISKIPTGILLSVYDTDMQDLKDALADPKLLASYGYQVPVLTAIVKIGNIGTLKAFHAFSTMDTLEKSIVLNADTPSYIISSIGDEYECAFDEQTIFLLKKMAAMY